MVNILSLFVSITCSHPWYTVLCSLFSPKGFLWTAQPKVAPLRRQRVFVAGPDRVVSLGKNTPRPGIAREPLELHLHDTTPQTVDVRQVFLLSSYLFSLKAWN